MLVIATILLWAIQIAALSQSYPISFAVLRNIDVPMSANLFLNRTSCCKADSMNNSVNYNIVSLDGFSVQSSLANLQSKPSPLASWVNAYSAIASNKPSEAGNTTTSVQDYLLNAYHKVNAKLLFNAFANEAPISVSNSSPDVVAQNIGNVLLATRLDGVSIEFSDYIAAAAGTASDWLKQLLLNLRNSIPGKTIVLIIPPTILSRITLGQQALINGLVDVFVLKYFDTGKQDYHTVQALLNTSTFYMRTAFKQLLFEPRFSADLCRTAIAKPADSTLQRTSSSFIDAYSLQRGFDSLYSDIGWFGGYANLDLQSDPQGKFQQTILENIRSRCIQSGGCRCS